MPNILTAVAYMKMIASDDSHGYDQENRYSPDFDCSSLVARALSEAGFDVSIYSWTGNLESQLIACGFKKCQKPWKAGDIHLKSGYHVCMSVDTNNVAEARINEFGGITGGQTGDQTGEEIMVRPYYEYSGGWDCHYRYVSNEALIYNWNPIGTATSTDNGVNVRESPNGNIIGQLGKGNRFEIDGKDVLGWIHVKVANIGVGYIYKDYVMYDNWGSILEAEPAQIFDDKIAGRYKVTNTDGEGLNIRLKASLSGDVIGTIPDGGVCRNYGYSTWNSTSGIEWYLIQYKDIIGYTSKNYLQRV